MAMTITFIIFYLWMWSALTKALSFLPIFTPFAISLFGFVYSFFTDDIVTNDAFNAAFAGVVMAVVHFYAVHVFKIESHIRRLLKLPE